MEQPGCDALGIRSSASRRYAAVDGSVEAWMTDGSEVCTGGSKSAQLHLKNRSFNDYTKQP
jgi:hypothetical protein